MHKTFWKNKKVLVTGHTGFKGTWLCLWLNMLGARVTGFSIDVPTNPALFKLTNPKLRTVWGDVRNLDQLKKTINQVKPDVVFHLAAQSLVRVSYEQPTATVETNTIGTANVLEALKGTSVKAAVIITTDKVYENKETKRPFKETDPLGGHDPYSSSKAAAEMIIAAYRNSFFNVSDYGKTHHTLIATARAGNVIGGGDFAPDRLLPDIIRAFSNRRELKLRHPKAIRPWQHVLESLHGYLLLAEKLYAGEKRFADAFNFGPEGRDAKPVEWIVKKMSLQWGGSHAHSVIKSKQVHEAHYLRLDISKAKKMLRWHPRWPLDEALEKTVVWAKAYQDREDMAEICREQIRQYSRGL